MTTASSPSTGVRTYRGSCQCGAVRFEADFNPSAGTTRCNCTICTKTAWWGVHMKPEAFRLVAGQEVLRDFSRHEALHALFCGVCGIRVFGHGDIPELGGAFYSVNLNCLDGADLSGVPVRYLDGLHDTWAELAVAPYLSPFSPTAHARA
ncbi:glutathione-dependent formaldehyde-activating, GFA [Cystobacter fuscus]|uniref:Glutathione-dependent formaldehyde-activating, GFA n=1 Tax=Cystobacter fuscus TaxID=43 RepID=A0A250IU52_9BACT|nr:GFA family protein [Cystobacter fuscus]ATB34793.1 glutathione-dependent formaldehyde-activating, GFA [Cystobacter fuscus]